LTLWALFAGWFNAVDDEDEHANALVVCLELMRNGFTAAMEPGTVFSPDVLELCVKTFGADNVIYGSDYPHTIGDMPGCLKRVNGLAGTARDKVRGRNAQRVFGL